MVFLGINPANPSYYFALWLKDVNKLEHKFSTISWCSSIYWLTVSRNVFVNYQVAINIRSPYKLDLSNYGHLGVSLELQNSDKQLFARQPVLKLQISIRRLFCFDRNSSRRYLIFAIVLYLVFVLFYTFIPMCKYTFRGHLEYCWFR